MSPNPIFSIITPVFNGEAHILETINSVLLYSRGYPVEYIVVDDGSTDATSAILSTLGESIRVLKQENSGESSAVNAGLAIARGDIILIVSADDPLFTSSLFEGAADFFNANPNVVAWYPDWNLIDNNGQIIEVRRPAEYDDNLMIGKFACLPGPGTLIRKSAALVVGGRRTRFRFTGDYDFWLRLSRTGELRHRSQVVAQWRFHDGSTSVAQRGKTMAHERIEVMQEFLATNKLPDDLRKMALAHSYYFAARLSLFDRKVPGRRYLIKAFAHRGKWIEEASPIVLLVIVSTPFSTIALRIFKRFYGPI